MAHCWRDSSSESLFFAPAQLPASGYRPPPSFSVDTMLRLARKSMVHQRSLDAAYSLKPCVKSCPNIYTPQHQNSVGREQQVVDRPCILSQLHTNRFPKSVLCPLTEQGVPCSGSELKKKEKCIQRLKVFVQFSSNLSQHEVLRRAADGFGLMIQCLSQPMWSLL